MTAWLQPDSSPYSQMSDPAPHTNLSLKRSPGKGVAAQSVRRLVADYDSTRGRNDSPQSDPRLRAGDVE